MAYPDFTRRLFMYFVIPDEAVKTMDVAYEGVAYTLENHRPDAENLVEELTYIIETEDGAEERSDYTVQEYIRLYNKANAGTLIIGAFFLMTFAFPLLMTIPVGVIFGKVYEIWNLVGLSGGKAIETAVMISLAVSGIYALYFFITFEFFILTWIHALVIM